MPLAATQARRSVGLVTADGKTFPLTRARLKSQAQGGMAHSVLTQDYRNPHAEPLEVIYTMPLPADGAVLGYTIKLGERIVRGEIKAREEAREEYFKALERGHTAGLLEQERADTFTQTLGNLPAGVDVRVEIEILQPLAFECGGEETLPSWTYRFPTVVGVRYQGEPGRVPDAKKLDAPRTDAQGTPVRLELEMQIADAGPAALAPRSGSHEIRTTGEGECTRVELAEASRLDRDLVLSWTAVADSVRAGLVEGRGLQGDDGRYALLTVTPPAAPESVQPRDLTVLLDCSGSMCGPPLEQAKAVIRKMIASLGDADRFELTAFSTRAVALTSGPVKAMDGRKVKKALSRLDALDAGGATEMQEAIVGALKQLRPESQRQVLLITDGYIGFESDVIGEVMKKLPGGTRLHAVGIGHAPNRSLTRSIARAGRGIEAIVGDNSDVAKSVDALLRGTAAPVLTDVAIGGSAIEGVRPGRLRDVFAGQPLVAAIELKPEGGTVEIVATLAGQDAPWEERIQVEALAAGAGLSTGSVTMPIGALYGRESVEDCELAALSGDHRSGERELLDGSIEQLGLRHRIVTRRTSLIAISEDPTVDPTDPRRRERLAVELPAGVSAEGVGFAEPMMQLCRFGSVESLGSIDSVAEPSRMRRPRDAGVIRLYQRALEEPSSPEEIAARVIRHDKDLLIVEFEAPEDEDFSVPSDDVTIILEFEVTMGCRVWIDRATSTRPGTCPGGTTVRLALRPDDADSELFAELSEWNLFEIHWNIDGEVCKLTFESPEDED